MSNHARSRLSLYSDIPSGGALELSIPTKSCAGTIAEINKLEHVVLTISFIHRRRGDVSILLMSPSGTKNEMLSTRHYDDSKEGLDNWGFMTVHCWGKYCSTSKISLVVSIFRIGQVRRIWLSIKSTSAGDLFVYSHNQLTWFCIDVKPLSNGLNICWEPLLTPPLNNVETPEEFDLV